MAQRLVQSQGQDPRRQDSTGFRRCRAAGPVKPVLAVVYLIFNEGYTASTGPLLVREDLCTEAFDSAACWSKLDADESEVTDSWR